MTHGGPPSVDRGGRETGAGCSLWKPPDTTQWAIHVKWVWKISPAAVCARMAKVRWGSRPCSLRGGG